MNVGKLIRCFVQVEGCFAEVESSVLLDDRCMISEGSVPLYSWYSEWRDSGIGIGIGIGLADFGILNGGILILSKVKWWGDVG